MVVLPKHCKVDAELVVYIVLAQFFEPQAVPIINFSTDDRLSLLVGGTGGAFLDQGLVSALN